MTEPEGGKIKGGVVRPTSRVQTIANKLTLLQPRGRLWSPKCLLAPPHFKIFHQPSSQECLLFLKFNSRLHTSSIIIFWSGFNISWIFSVRPKCIWEAKIASWVQFCLSTSYLRKPKPKDPPMAFVQNYKTFHRTVKVSFWHLFYNRKVILSSCLSSKSSIFL